MTGDPSKARARMHDAVARAAAMPCALAAASVLAPLFDDLAWLHCLTEAWLAPLHVDPADLHQLAAGRNGPALTVTLAAQAPVRLALRLVEGAAERIDAPMVGAGHVGFSGTQALYRLLSANPVDALLCTLDADHGALRTDPFRLEPGRPLVLDERRQALRIDPQLRPTMLLTARIERVPAPPVRRYALATGACVGTVQGDDGFARSAMLLALLRAGGFRAAVPTMIALLERPSARERWIVMRELLALDAQAAWPHLVRMAEQDPEPVVRGAAQAVLARHAAREAA